MNELSHVRPGNKFKPHFHLFNIVDVNGRSEHPLFKFLKVRFFFRLIMVIQTLRKNTSGLMPGIDEFHIEKFNDHHLISFLVY